MAAKAVAFRKLSGQDLQPLMTSDFEPVGEEGNCDEYTFHPALAVFVACLRVISRLSFFRARQRQKV